MIRPHELEEYLPGPRSAPRRPEGRPLLMRIRVRLAGRPPALGGTAPWGAWGGPAGAVASVVTVDGPLGRVGRAEASGPRAAVEAGRGVMSHRAHPRSGASVRRAVPWCPGPAGFLGPSAPPARAPRPGPWPTRPCSSRTRQGMAARPSRPRHHPLPRPGNRVSNCRGKGTRGGGPPASGRRRPPLPRAPSNAPSITIGHHRGPAARSALLAVRHRVLLDRDRPRCAEAARDGVAMAEGAQGAPGAQNRSQAGIRPIPAKGGSGPSSPRTVTTSILPKTAGDFRSMVTTCRD